MGPGFRRGACSKCIDQYSKIPDDHLLNVSRLIAVSRYGQ